MVTAAELMAGMRGEVWTPRERLHVDEWADRYRVLVSRASKRHGRWDTNVTPYLRRPMRAFSHHAVRRITEMFASQLGKTESIENMKMYLIDEGLGNALVMMGTVEAVRNFNEDRFLPSVRACPRVARHLMPSPQDTKIGKVIFDQGTFYFFGSNSKDGRRGNPVPYLFFDEIGTYVDPDWVEARDRVKGGDGTHKIVESSTPEDEEMGIHEAFLQGSREYYFVPCPRCGAYQRLIFAGLTWDGGGQAGKDEARATARYICQNKACQAAIRNYEKPAMLARGVWVPESRELADVLAHGQGSAGGTGAGNIMGIEREHLSFQLSSLYSPFESASWGEMAARYVEDFGRMTPSFVRGWLGEPNRIAGERVAHAEVRRLCTPVDSGGYRAREVPAGVLVILRAIDVQKDCVWVVDRGFGERGIDTFLIDFYRVPRREGLGLADVWPSLPRAYKRVGVMGPRALLQVRAEFIDSGHYTAEIYKAVLERRGMGVPAFPVKGKSESSAMAAGWTLSAIEKLPDGTPIRGLPRLLLVNSDYWKTHVMSRIRGTLADSGLEEEERKAGVVPGFYLPEEDEEGRITEYMAQVTAEEKFLDRGRKMDRRPKVRWRLRPGQTQNHAFDAECYVHCGADFLGVRRMRPPPAKASSAGPA